MCQRDQLYRGKIEVIVRTSNQENNSCNIIDGEVKGRDSKIMCLKERRKEPLKTIKLIVVYFEE